MARGAKPPVVLIDVNVLLDVFVRREPFFRDSGALLAACEAGRCQGLVAAHSLTTLAYFLGRQRGTSTAKAAIASLLRIVGVATVDGQVIHDALASRRADFEDAVQISAAVAAGAKYIATRNLKDFAGSPVPAAAPAELVPALLAF